MSPSRQCELLMAWIEIGSLPPRSPGMFECVECGADLPQAPTAGEPNRCDACHFFAIAELIRGQMVDDRAASCYARLLLAGIGAGWWIDTAVGAIPPP